LARRDACVSAYQRLVDRVLTDPTYTGPEIDYLALGAAAAVYENVGDEGPWQREMARYR
jgi:hypothetical protein